MLTWAEQGRAKATIREESRVNVLILNDERVTKRPQVTCE